MEELRINVGPWYWRHVVWFESWLPPFCDLPAYQRRPRLVDQSNRTQPLVDSPGGNYSCSSVHHPHLYGPTDNGRHHQPQRAQTVGKRRYTCLPLQLPTEAGEQNVYMTRLLPDLQKGCGYHLDLLIVGVMLAVCSIMGLPWFVAATVLSISHVNSLKLESESSAPGEMPRFLGIREQRLTGLIIFLLMGCSVFMTGALQVSQTSYAIVLSPLGR